MREKLRLRENLRSSKFKVLGTALLFLICFLGVMSFDAKAQNVESLGYKLHKTSSIFGPQNAMNNWLKKNSSTEIVSFTIDKNNNVYFITK